MNHGMIMNVCMAHEKFFGLWVPEAKPLGMLGSGTNCTLHIASCIVQVLHIQIGAVGWDGRCGACGVVLVPGTGPAYV